MDIRRVRGLWTGGRVGVRSCGCLGVGQVVQGFCLLRTLGACA